MPLTSSFSHDLLPSDLVAQSVEQRWSNSKVVGSNLTLVRVFLCPCVGPFPSVGLTLTWYMGWNISTLHHILSLPFNVILSYLCKWTGVFPMWIGKISPAAPSLVVFGVNLSAITVNFTVGSLSRIHTAEESPMMPAPTTPTDPMFVPVEEIFRLWWLDLSYLYKRPLIVQELRKVHNCSCNLVSWVYFPEEGLWKRGWSERDNDSRIFM